MVLFIIKFKCNKIIRKNKDKIDWDQLSRNKNAIDLLEKIKKK